MSGVYPAHLQFQPQIRRGTAVAPGFSPGLSAIKTPRRRRLPLCRRPGVPGQLARWGGRSSRSPKDEATELPSCPAPPTSAPKRRVAHSSPGHTFWVAHSSRHHRDELGYAPAHLRMPSSLTRCQSEGHDHFVTYLVGSVPPSSSGFVINTVRPPYCSCRSVYAVVFDPLPPAATAVTLEIATSWNV